MKQKSMVIKYDKDKDLFGFFYNMDDTEWDMGLKVKNTIQNKSEMSIITQNLPRLNKLYNEIYQVEDIIKESLQKLEVVE